MLYCHCQIWLISNRSLTMFYNQDRTFTPGCFFITFCRDGLNSDNYCMTEPDWTFVPVQWHLKHWPNVWLFISYRRNQHRASSVHRGVWTSNLWGNGVTPITTEPCVPHGKSCWIIFQLIMHHKVRKVKLVPLYRTLESISDTWYFNGVLSFL